MYKKHQLAKTQASIPTVQSTAPAYLPYSCTVHARRARLTRGEVVVIIAVQVAVQVSQALTTRKVRQVVLRGIQSQDSPVAR